MRTSKTALQELLGRSRFVSGYGLRLVSVSDAECTIAMPFRKAFERPGGTVNGPAFMAAADCAMWLAIKTQSGLADTSVTSHMQTSFLSSAKKHGFLCRAKVLRAGRRTTYGEASCLTKEGKLLTHHTLTYVRPDRG